jgi:hypothetical protein
MLVFFQFRSFYPLTYLEEVSEVNSFYWAQLSMFHLQTETESNLQNVVF